MNNKVSDKVKVAGYPLPIIDKSAYTLISKMISVLDEHGLIDLSLHFEMQEGSFSWSGLSSPVTNDLKLSSGVSLSDHSELIINHVVSLHKESLEESGDLDDDEEGAIYYHELSLEKNTLSGEWAIFYNLQRECEIDDSTEFSFKTGYCLEKHDIDNTQIIDFMGAFSIDRIRVSFLGGGNSGYIERYEYLDACSQPLAPPLGTIIYDNVSFEQAMTHYSSLLCDQIPD